MCVKKTNRMHKNDWMVLILEPDENTISTYSLPYSWVRFCLECLLAFAICLVLDHYLKVQSMLDNVKVTRAHLLCVLIVNMNLPDL